MTHILYNPLAGGGKGETFANKASAAFKDSKLVSLIDLDAKDYLSKLTGDDEVIICGGDGTLNRFANDTYGIDYPCAIYLYKSGTGNDFLKDVEDKVKDNMLRTVSYTHLTLPTKA